ncbi:MAG: bacteriochlorophyll 4-vinyl reductase [Pseudomonadota bacterium]
MAHAVHRAGGVGLIGPNAILQLVPVIEQAGGRALRDEVFAAAGVFDLPSGDQMISEAPAARVHQALRAQVPNLAAALAWEAGRRTADYILANRIPAFAQRILKALPWRLSAQLLSKAIQKNAWTFAGSGTFRVLTPLRFELADNPIVAGETSETPLCHWHAAVFERLYQVLVHPQMICRETDCIAQGAGACRFELRLG